MPIRISNNLSSLTTKRILTTNNDRVGINQDRLTRTANNPNFSVKNLIQAESTNRNADLGLEFAELTRNQILVQISATIVGLSNLIPKSVLRLLR